MRCQGYSLIEVMVALLILSVGILSIAGMQLSALNDTEVAYSHSLAIVQAVSMQYRLRANHTAISRARELTIWNQQNQHLLARGTGNFKCKEKQCCITLNWQRQTKQQVQVGDCL